LPEHSFDDMAYVLKFTFDGTIPTLDKYTDLNTSPHYYIVPGNNTGALVLGADLSLSGKRKDAANQWKLEALGKGFYIIHNRNNGNKVLEVKNDKSIAISDISRKDQQVWKIENTFNGLLKISNKQYAEVLLTVNIDKETVSGWKVMEVCETKQEAFRNNSIPGTIEVEDFDKGCPGDAYYDRDEANAGGQYRTSEGIDIENCAAGGFNIGWTNNGEFMAYTVTVSKAATYQASFFVATPSDNTKLHLECDGVDVSGVILVPNTGGYQNWQAVQKSVKLEAGQHVLKLVVDEAPVNMDKMIFEEIK